MFSDDPQDRCRILLAHDADLVGWRAHVRRLIADDIPPEAVQWRVVPPADLYAPKAERTLPDTPASFRLSRRVVRTLMAAIHAPDPERFQILHREILKALGRDSEAMTGDGLETLAATARAAALDARDRLDPPPGQSPAGWRSDASPAILRAQAPFMMARRTGPWALLSPEAAMVWDGHALRFGAGDASDETDPQALWDRADALCKAGPGNEYWTELPVLDLNCDVTSVLEAPSLADLRSRAPDCRNCALWKPASRTVFGEGKAGARLMFVGEQPGDQEDLAGRPFVGPAGQLLGRCLDAAGIAREDAYVTNAVKHFRFVPRGSRRIHEKPGAEHIDACAPWLAAERRLVQPKVLVMLGASAAQAVLGRPVTISRERSQPIMLNDRSRGLVTTHPSYLLRVPEAAKARETGRFIEDLKRAASWIAE